MFFFFHLITVSVRLALQFQMNRNCEDLHFVVEAYKPIYQIMIDLLNFPINLKMNKPM